MISIKIKNNEPVDNGHANTGATLYHVKVNLAPFIKVYGWKFKIVDQLNNNVKFTFIADNEECYTASENTERNTLRTFPTNLPGASTPFKVKSWYSPLETGEPSTVWLKLNTGLLPQEETYLTVTSTSMDYSYSGDSIFYFYEDFNYTSMDDFKNQRGTIWNFSTPELYSESDTNIKGDGTISLRTTSISNWASKGYMSIGGFLNNSDGFSLDYKHLYNNIYFSQGESTYLSLSESSNPVKYLSILLNTMNRGESIYDNYDNSTISKEMIVSVIKRDSLMHLITNNIESSEKNVKSFYSDTDSSVFYGMQWTKMYIRLAHYVPSVPMLGNIDTQQWNSSIDWIRVKDSVKEDPTCILSPLTHINLYTELPQFIENTPTDSIECTGAVALNSISLVYDKDSSSHLYIALSFDGRSSWRVYDSSTPQAPWVAINKLTQLIVVDSNNNIDTINTKGMTVEQFNNIPADAYSIALSEFNPTNIDLLFGYKTDTCDNIHTAFACIDTDNIVSSDSNISIVNDIKATFKSTYTFPYTITPPEGIALSNYQIRLNASNAILQYGENFKIVEHGTSTAIPFTFEYDDGRCAASDTTKLSGTIKTGFVWLKIDVLSNQSKQYEIVSTPSTINSVEPSSIFLYYNDFKGASSLASAFLSEPHTFVSGSYSISDGYIDINTPQYASSLNSPIPFFDSPKFNILSTLYSDTSTEDDYIYETSFKRTGENVGLAGIAINYTPLTNDVTSMQTAMTMGNGIFFGYGANVGSVSTIALSSPSYDGTKLWDVRETQHTPTSNNTYTMSVNAVTYYNATSSKYAQRYIMNIFGSSTFDPIIDIPLINATTSTYRSTTEDYKFNTVPFDTGVKSIYIFASSPFNTNDTSGMSVKFNWIRTRSTISNINTSPILYTDKDVKIEGSNIYSIPHECTFETTNNKRFTIGNHSGLLQGVGPLNIEYEKPTGTDIKVLVSFDNRNTWKKWNSVSHSWDVVLKSDISTSGNSVDTITASTVVWSSELIWSSNTANIDYLIYMSTNNELSAPTIKNISLNSTYRYSGKKTNILKILTHLTFADSPMFNPKKTITFKLNVDRNSNVQIGRSECIIPSYVQV